MPRYWILSMSEDNYLIAKERGVIGVTGRGRRAIYEWLVAISLPSSFPRSALMLYQMILRSAFRKFEVLPE